MASSSSFASDSQYCPQWKYDVFLSFRGVDTRKTFTGHLYEGLKNRKIITFQDDKRLENGDIISEELLKAIEESQVALIIFSKNYATSSWCLNELVKIMECKEKNGQTIIPIFYDVDPSHVRHQSESFAEAFAKHELRFKDNVEEMQKVQGWRTALRDAADLKGCHIHDRIEAECIREVVADVSSKLCNTSSSYLQDIVGINTHLEKVKSLLEMETNDVRILGIWGMGGVGKTTIARAIFDTLSPQFQSACFLDDVKETKKNEMHSLQNKLLSELLRKDKIYVKNKEKGKRLMARRLRCMKVLVVLDDINHHDHWEYLAGDLRWFGNGSRIIATTRNKQIIGKNNAVYEMTTLLKNDAIQLFNHYAFKEEAPDEHTKELALEVVSHAKGLPLALKLWGTTLHYTDTTMWREVVDMIKRESDPDIVMNLKISFKPLKDEEKKIFLDIACFFRGKEKDETIEVLESYDSCAGSRLQSLIEKSLVFISKYNTIQMHDLIQDMGRYVVKKQKDSGKPTRLWKVKDFEDMMVNNTGTDAVEAIWFNYPGKLRVSKEAMKNMPSLRMLYLGYQDASEENDGSIEYLSNNLCWCLWWHYPWKLLPQNFNPTKLVFLNLQHSSLHHLWNETKQLSSLRRLDLSYSKSLKRTPDFTGMPNLEYLYLSDCDNLEEVHHSLKYSRKLIELELQMCRSLKMFLYVNVESLKSLKLYCCSSLEKFPEIVGIMKPKLVIETSTSEIRKIPSSIIHPQAHRTKLDLRAMSNLVSLPSNICKLKDLVKLYVSECSKLKSLPKGIGDLEKLEKLGARDTLISRLPSSIVRLKRLKLLDLSGCNLIDGGLPEDIGSLSSLQELNLSGKFKYLPRSIAQLGSLQSLDLSQCQELKEFPGFMGMPNLEYLNLSCCNSIDGVLPEDICSLSSLKVLDLSYCSLTDGGLPKDIGSLSSLQELNLRGNKFEYLPESIAQLGSLRSLDLLHCRRLTKLPKFPQQLNIISADWDSDSICNLLFQNISSLQRDISVSDSLSLRVFTSKRSDIPHWIKIPSWFHHQGEDKVNLPENWYGSGNLLGFAVCYTGRFSDHITANLDPLCDDGSSSMTLKFSLSDHSEYGRYVFFVPLTGLWDESNANGKKPNDYGYFRLFPTYYIRGFGVRLLYKDEAGMRRSRYEEVNKGHSFPQGNYPTLCCFIDKGISSNMFLF